MSAGGRELVRELSFSQEDFDAFAALSGDDNPIHVDPAFAARTRFGRTVAHGVLLQTVFRGLLEALAPGCRQEDQTLMFTAPSFADEPLRFRARVEAARPGRLQVALEVTRVADGETTCRGHTVLRTAAGATS